MRSILDVILFWAERKLPDTKSIWVSDLRDEAKHISGIVSRQHFLWSGVLTAIGQVLRIRFGIQRVGQTLLGLALLTLCLGGLFITKDMPDDVVRTVFYGALGLYAFVGGLVFLNLNVMRRFTFICGLGLIILSIALRLNLLPALEPHSGFLRAFALEAAFMMAGLFVAASYLGWIKDPDHA